MIWEEEPLGGYPDPALLGLPGLERMWSSRRGIALLPPIVYLTEMGWEEVSRGNASFTIPASPWFGNATGLIPGGMLAVLADAPLGAALGSVLEAAETFTTAEISLTFLRPVRPDPDVRISAGGQLIHRSARVGLTEAFLINEGNEELVAFASSRLSIFPPPDPPPEPPGDLEPVEPEIPGSDPSHPLRRPVEGDVLDPEIFASRSGREVLEGFISGELPAPPISHLIGIHPTRAGDGEFEARMPCSPWLSTAARTVQGGFTALLAEAALAGAAFSTTEPGTPTAPLDLKVNFLRPVYPDMRDLTAQARVVHRGRTLAISTATITNADGKPVALATGSAMYLPGRPPDLTGVELGGEREE